MEIRIFRYFLTVVREGSITKASEVLHITQPTLSRQLSQMGEEVGVILHCWTGLLSGMGQTSTELTPGDIVDSHGTGKSTLGKIGI